MPIDEPHQSAAHLPDHVAAPIGADEAGQALKEGPKGALLIARHLVVRHSRPNRFLDPKDSPPVSTAEERKADNL